MSSLVVTGDLSQSSYDGCQVYSVCVVMWCAEPFQYQAWERTEVDIEEEDAEDEEGEEEEAEITNEEEEVSRESSVVFGSQLCLSLAWCRSRFSGSCFVFFGTVEICT